MPRPCRYCISAYPTVADEVCGVTHRDEQRVYDLAAAMARIFQPHPTTDERIGWFLQDADAVVDDFDPAPTTWRLRKLPDDFSEFVARFRINGQTYVLRDGDGYVAPVRLSLLRQWQREADEEYAQRMTSSG